MAERWVSRLRALAFSWLDVKVGLRMLARYPGLTIVGTLAIAVAIALGTVYFEAIGKWQDPRLPVRQSGRVVQLRNWDTREARTDGRLLHDFVLWREQVRTVQHLGAAIPFVRNVATEDRRLEPVSGAEISASAFRVMEVAPLLGRALTPDDERPDAPPVVVIGQALWASRFASDPAVLGRTVRVGTAPATVVGVMPEGFGFPVNQRLWLPLRVDGAALAPRTGPTVTVFGRLAPGASLADAQAELAVLGARLTATSPQTHEHLRPRVTTYAKPIVEGGQWRVIRNVLFAVNVVFLALLAVVSANVATLVFARTATRGWEMTMRTALGATRGRIVVQLFVEALVLTGIAAALGLLLARLALRWGVQLLSGEAGMPFWIDDGISLRTVAYAALLALAGAAIVGILPALRVTRINVQDALRSEHAARSGLRFGGFSTAAIIVQVALTVALLPLAAGGAFESNRFQQRADGIGADRYITASVGVDREDHRADSATVAARARASYDELERRLLAEPGVEGVAFADRLPVMDQFKYRIAIDTASGTPATGVRHSTLVQVSRGFLATFGSRVIAGRDFTPSDFETGRALLVNESFVKHVLGGRNPVGQRLKVLGGEDGTVAGEAWYEVVGLVRDFGWQLPEPHEQSAMYRPRLPTQLRDVNLAAKVPDVEAFATRLRTIAAEVDPSLRLTEVQPLTDVGGSEAKSNWALTTVALVVGLMVMLLSATGIHALMAFTVTCRTREIGIRAALGASRGRIVRGIFTRAFVQAGAGIVLGSGLAALVGLGSLRQLLLLLGADLLMLAVGMAACALPLRRALRVQPTEALRSEG